MGSKIILRIATAAMLIGCLTAADRKASAEKVSPLDRYIEESLGGTSGPSHSSPGSLWTPSARLTDLGSDVRASQVNDLITIVVLERASAVAQGTTKTQRQSSATASVSAAGGITKAAGPLANLANVSSATQLDGQGATSRASELSTTLSARVTHVLPNGYLVIEGNKEVTVNSERQTVTVRGVIRPVDLTPENLIPSNLIAQMELKINGKGVVGDAVRRPFFLYRLLLGILPF
jgi:flagellar L-ring protein precursor FlgH